MNVQLEGEQEAARLDLSDPRSATFLASLQDLEMDKRPVYVVIDLVTRFIQRVSAPLIVTVRDVIPLNNGDYRVRLETSAAIHTLRRDNPYFGDFLKLLQDARKNHAWVLVTGESEIIDVRYLKGPQRPDLRAWHRYARPGAFAFRFVQRAAV